MESQLHQEMIDMFYVAGKETGYWGRYFLRSVKNNGGLQTAKKMLSKRLEKPSEQKGLRNPLSKKVFKLLLKQGGQIYL